MKKMFFFSLMLMTFCTTSIAQSFPSFSEIKLEVKEDYNKDANDAALFAAKYLLSTPLEKDNLYRLKCTQYLIRWMTGTPDYTFSLVAGKLFKKNDDLLVVYMAALTKYCMENKLNGKEGNIVQVEAYKLIGAYCKNEGNGVKKTGEVKKLVTAYENNTLEEYLEIKK